MVRIARHEAAKILEELLEQAARGEEVIIESEDGSLFTLTATKKAKPRPRFGSAREEAGWMSDDFDEPLDDFREYMS